METQWGEETMYSSSTTLGGEKIRQGTRNCSNKFLIFYSKIYRYKAGKFDTFLVPSSLAMKFSAMYVV